MSALDRQVGGEHYREGGIQPVEYIESNKLGFLEGCVVKRLTRHERRTGKGRQDIEKAIHELQLLLELRYPLPTVVVNNAPTMKYEWAHGYDEKPNWFDAPHSATHRGRVNAFGKLKWFWLMDAGGGAFGTVDGQQMFSGTAILDGSISARGESE